MSAMAWILCGLLAIGVILDVSGHTLHFGRSCPNAQPFPNLEVEKVLGSWYVLHKTDTDNTCLIWNLTRGVHPDTLQLKEARQLSVLELFRVDHTHAVTARIDIPNPEVPGKMRIRWPTSLTGKADFVVFDTDYDNYMAIFECDRAGFLHRRSTAILSRTQDVDETIVERVRRLLDTFDANHSYLTEISHDTCRKSGGYDWHIDGEIFGGSNGNNVRPTILEIPQDYDITQLEIIEDLGNPSFNFRGNLEERKPGV